MDIDELARNHGLEGIVLFPHYPRSALAAKPATFLSAVGLPTGRVFLARAEVDAADPDPIELGPLFDLDGGDSTCPPERRHWPVLGHTPGPGPRLR
ncbi:hypothetical protein GTW40_16560 [Streptomyces sp. SID4985]|uniref:hypothetical protein n=1 Tax=Streptomyces sp. SID4985 TaxID=2690292 RepID=UPI00136D8542|nr:hypothetical protein [Streptomyces sp. SID4985]MYQ46648.1 hypothetical protein [Streptomyces sp. SID4985]